MELQPITSSSIAAVGYDEATQTLRIRFCSLAEYEYANVPPVTFELFMRAESKGRFFADFIKPRFDMKCVVERLKKEKASEEKPEEKPAKAARPKRTAI